MMKACENCSSLHNGEYGSGRFCSSKCARGFSTKNKRKEISEKVSKTLTGHKLSDETKKKISENNGKYWSGKIRTNETKEKIRIGNAKYTGKKKIKDCKKCNERKLIAIKGNLCDDCKGAFRVYKELCIFKFNVYDYPEHFDLSLIDRFGWYTASNKKNPNLMGISRDHKISISEGFRLSIDPLIISHVANCRLLQHTDNQRKNTKCSITLDELKLKIKNM